MVSENINTVPTVALKWTNVMNQRTKRGIESACKASKESKFPRYHLGAALYYKGILLATGCNSTKTSPLQKRLNAEREFDPNQSGVINSLHAEIRALSKVKYLDIDFSKSTLYVYREYANGNKAMARPCPACMKYIKELGIKHICYSTSDGIAEERID
jgi:deoxycytidylate deaminase